MRVTEHVRVASLAPSASSTVDALGGADQLVGVTSHCKPDGPILGGWLNPDYDAIDRMDADLLFTADALQRGIRDELRDRGHEVCHLEPSSLDDVLDSFVEIGRAIDRESDGLRLRDECRARLADVAERVIGCERPVVYCEEWSDPPMVAGNWVPDVVDVAGGSYPFVKPGERSRPVSRETVEEAAPELVVLHLCGRGTHVDRSAFRERGWSLPAIERDAIHVVDDSLLNRPGPTLVDGVESLARLLHPGRFDVTEGPNRR